MLTLKAIPSDRIIGALLENRRVILLASSVKAAKNMKRLFEIMEHGYKVMWFKGPSDVPRWGEAIPRAAFGETYVSSYPLAPIAYRPAIHLAQ